MSDFLSFARQLADNDLKLRTETLRALESYLSVRGGSLSQLEHAKVWKGLFYCVWLSDGLVTQQELCRSLAALVHCFGAEHDAALAFVRAFCDTLQREWSLLDQHRVDKYYYLMRQVMRETIRFIARRRWAASLLTSLRDLLLSSALSLSGVYYAGLSLALARHFCPLIHDIAREEACDPGAALGALVEPFLRFYALALDKRYVAELTDTFFEPLLNCDAADDRFSALSLLSVGQLCDALASDRKLDIIPSRRQFLYQVQRRIETQVKRKQTPMQRTDGTGDADDIDDDVHEGAGDVDENGDVDAALGGADEQERQEPDADDHEEQENKPPPVLARVDSEVSIDMTPKKSKKLLARVDSEVSFDMTPKSKKQRATQQQEEEEEEKQADAAVPQSQPSEPLPPPPAALKRRVSWGAAHARHFHNQEPPATVAEQETHQSKIKTHKPKPKYSFLPVRMQQKKK